MTPRPEPFWQRVHECLDRRTDPLRDLWIAARVTEDPGLLDEVLAMRDAIAIVETAPLRRATRRRRLPRAVAAAVAILAVAVVAARHASRDAPPASDVSRDGRLGSRILDYRIELVRASADEELRVEATARGTVETRVIRTLPAPVPVETARGPVAATFTTTKWSDGR